MVWYGFLCIHFNYSYLINFISRIPGNLPSTKIDHAAAAAAVAAGQASASQALIETAAGIIYRPSYIQFISGVLASVGQDEEISQTANAEKPSGTTSTIPSTLLMKKI